MKPLPTLVRSHRSGSRLFRAVAFGFIAAAPFLAPSCSGQPEPASTPGEPGTVDFASSSITIDRLEVPLALPVAIGSRPSGTLLVSSDPTVLSVEADGRVVAHRNGEARVVVRDRLEAGLEVKVLAARSISIIPQRFALRPGNEQRMRLLDALSGDEIPAEAGEWATDVPGVLMVQPGFVKAWQPGKGGVRVRYAGSEALAEVEVEPDPAGLRVLPPRVTLKRGEVAVLRAMAGGRESTAAEWRSHGPAVLASSGDGLFEARAVGRTKACAASMGHEACADVEVRP